MGGPHSWRPEWLRKLFAKRRKPASGPPSETPSQSTSLPVHPSPAADNPPKTLASAVASPIDLDPSPKSTPNIPANSEPKDLWDRAEEELSNDKRKAEILKAYKEILRSQLGSELAARGTASRHEQMSRLLNTKVEELERQKWKLHLGDHNIEVETLFSGVVRNILLAKDIISSAALADPHAALACAGVSVILTLLIQPLEQRAVLLKGLNYISTLICRFNVVEHVYRSRARIPSLRQEDAVRFEKEFEANLTTLYSQILEFQARALCHLSKHPVTQFFKDMFEYDDWGTLLQDIQGSESQCKGFNDLIDGEKLHKGLEEQKARMRELQQIANSILNMLKEDREEQKELARKAKKLELFKKFYTSPYSDRKDRNPERVEGTCEWFISHQRFRNWQESKTSSLLWVSADPGCGKSVLAKYLVDTVLPSTASRTTCYFFFKDDFEDQRSAVSALCCTLRQLFIQNNALLSDKILEKFETDGEKLIGSFRGLWDILLSAAEDHNAGEIICILDALDECEDEGRAQITEALRELYGTRTRKFSLKFLLTSRPYVHIQRDFQSLENRLPTIHLSGESELELEKISQEINVFIKNRVKDIGANLQLLPDEQKLLQDELTRVPNRTYLWVYLTLDVIRKSVNISTGSIRRGMNEIPKTVEEAYDKILCRSYDSKKAMRLLHIVVAATRPLSLNEMALALAIKENHRTYDDLNLELEPEVRFRATVRELCGLFVTIIDSKIYLLHQTAKEFLVQKETLDATNPPNHENGHLEWKFSLRTADSNRILAEICIWYLLTYFETYSRGASQENDQSLDNHVFLDYSAKNWAAHFRAANIRSDEAIVSSVLRICDPDIKSCLTWFKIYWTTINLSYPRYLTALIIASYFGLEAVVKQLLAVDGVDVNSKDGNGPAALSWAAGNGHEAVVKQLLATDGVDVNSKDEYGWTALSWAAGNGEKAVVKQLLAVDGVDVNSKDNNYGWTALSLAAGNGHEAVVEQLLAVDGVDVNSKDDRYGWTALSWAAGNGNEAMVKQLLAVDGVDVNSRDDEYGLT